MVRKSTFSQKKLEKTGCAPTWDKLVLVTLLYIILGLKTWQFTHQLKIFSVISMPQMLCLTRMALNGLSLAKGMIYIPLNTHQCRWSLWLWPCFRKNFNPLLWAIGSSWKEHMPFFVVLPQFLGAIGPIRLLLVPKSQFFLLKWLTHLTQIVSPESSWDNDHFVHIY